MQLTRRLNNMAKTVSLRAESSKSSMRIRIAPSGSTTKTLKVSLQDLLNEVDKNIPGFTPGSGHSKVLFKIKRIEVLNQNPVLIAVRLGHKFFDRKYESYSNVTKHGNVLASYEMTEGEFLHG
jgi:hypothetical protein